MFSDLRYVIRSLAANRAFALVTIFTLALGIGSAAAIFSVVDRVLFQSKNFPEGVVLLGLERQSRSAKCNPPGR
jgi:hypothetical protein